MFYIYLEQMRKIIKRQINLKVKFKQQTSIKLLNMIESRLYDPSELVKIEHENKYKNHPELYLKRDLIVQEREFVQQIIYMIQGLETQLFVKVYDEVEFDSENGSVEKLFQFAMKQSSRIVFTHLTNETLKTCAEIPIKIANFLQYLTSKSRTIYEKSTNLFIKSFSQGIMQYISRSTVEFTQILTQIQMESGELSNRNPINNNQSILFVQQQQSLTLLKINHVLEQKTLFISQLVNIFSKILPYVSLDVQGSPTDKYLAIQILFNQFSRLTDTIQLIEKEKHELRLIYQNCLILYVSMIKNWIEMNPYLLQSMKSVSFFIKVSQVNFSLSKCSFSHQKYIKLRSGSYQSMELKQQIYKSEEFSQLFFKLQNLLVQEYMPELFKKQGLCILELGKIIQFIYLYFSTQEKPFIGKYFDVQKEFKPLFQLIESSKNIKKLSQTQSMFINDKFPRKERKKISISQRMAEKQRNPLRYIEVKEDNPYEMFPLTRGIFMETQTSLASLACEKDNGQKQIMGVESIAHFEMMDEESQMRSNSIETFGLKFERILSEIIEKLYQKALYFFQQQSEKQFFKLESHLKIPSQSLVLNSKLSFLQKKSSFMQMESSLAQIIDHQRIIESISLTLIGIKKFMLYEQGDFFLELTSIASTLFESSSVKISKSLITSYIEEAIKSSSANDLPLNIKGKISFLFLKKTKNPEIKQLKVWSVFSILYRPQFPVNCIFNNQIMNNFGEIFNFIFNIKQCQHTLKNIWEDFKENAKITTQYSLFQIKKHPFQSKILAVRNNIHHFVNLIFGSVMITIEELWGEYTQQINFSFLSSFSSDDQGAKKTKKLYNPISIIKLTEDLLRNLKRQITENLTLANTMILITQLIGKFKKLLRMQPDSKDWNDVIFGQEIGYIGHEFMGIMEMAKNIQGIGESIFYNIQF